MSITVTQLDRVPVWRVGFKPDPWAWSGWEWSHDGRFTGRWDDRAGIFRTVYVGASLLGCLLEVLAPLRPDPHVTAALDGIIEDDEYAALHPTIVPGQLSRAWLTSRCIGTATLSGSFCDVTTSANIAALRSQFVGRALALGLDDYDAAALKDARARELTQAVATHLHGTTLVDGVAFRSRHGDEQRLWAIFERPGALDPIHPLCLQDRHEANLDGDEPELVQALDLFGLSWTD